MCGHQLCDDFEFYPNVSLGQIEADANFDQNEDVQCEPV